MINQVHIKYFSTPLGELILGSLGSELCLCDWRYRKMRTAIDQRILRALDAEFIEGESEVISDTILQLKEYFDGNRKEFNIPMKMFGSSFQVEVWNSLVGIPYGGTESYLGLSRKLGNEKAIRAVASANGANALAILIPCHRIIGSSGELIGYAGGLSTKKRLLMLEAGVQHNHQLELFS